MFRFSLDTHTRRWRTVLLRLELLLCLLFVTFAFVPTPPVRAAPAGPTFLWTGSGPDPRWSTNENWSGGLAPQPGSNLIFPLGAAQLNPLNDFTAGTSFYSIQVNAPGYNIGGNGFNLTGYLDTSFDGASTIANNISFGSMGTFETVVSTSATNLTLGGQLSGTGVGLSKFGAGTLTLTGTSSNTYDGMTTVGGGTLVLNKTGGATAISGPLTVQTGSTLLLQNSNQTATTTPLSLYGTFNLNDYSNALGSLAGSGNVNLGTGTLTTGANNTSTTFSGGITGTGNLTKAGTGTLTLGGTGSNTYTGTTTVSGGTLSLNKTGTQALYGPLVIGDSTGMSAGPHTVRMQGSNQIFDTSTVTVYGAGVFDLNNFSDQIAGLTLHSGTGQSASVTTGTGTLTLAGNLTLNVGGTGTVGATIGGRLDLGGATRTFNVADGAANPDLNVSALILNGGVDKIGPGTLQFGGTNLYSGNTTVTAGTLLVNGVNSSSAHWLNGGTLGGTGTVGSVQMAQMANGTIAPGTTGPGILSSGNTWFGSATTFQVQLNGTTPGSGYDQLNVTGNVILGNATLNLAQGFTPQVGDVYAILLNDGTDPIEGMFNGLNEGASFTTGGTTFQITYQGGGSPRSLRAGNDVMLTVISVSFRLYLPLVLR